MNVITDFWKWWTSSDWGKPNSLTRLGIPRLATNLLSYLVGPYVAYLLTLKYVPGADYRTYRLFTHNIFILLAYGVFYCFFLTHEFLSFKYKAKGTELNKIVRKNWTDPFVRISWMCFLMSFVLFLIGCLQVLSHWP